MPWSYGRKGGTTAKDVDYGEGGDGRVKLDLKGYLVVDGSILTEGGEGRNKGGGGSGGSIHIMAYKM